MKKIIKTIRFVISFILLGFGFFAFLAGTDIYHGTEPDLSSEWFILSSFFYLSYLFVIINVVDFFIKEKKIN
jgi:hypothetical protein